MFTSFHHFGPADARRILEDAVGAGAPIAVFEFTERRATNFVRMLFAPLPLLADSWRIRPRTWARVLWTYVVPVVPVLYLWDGLVSHWRSYGRPELRALAAGFPGYRWRVGAVRAAPARVTVTYLIGLPAATPSAAKANAA
jgi:hypothetical protein